jgi:hypothetical protein
MGSIDSEQRGLERWGEESSLSVERVYTADRIVSQSARPERNFSTAS